jgi:2-keto-4-pentenoate hydratase/2-oxohepta-3-ene-1,7-dioic acid hydratase in catechol pathway
MDKLICAGKNYLDHAIEMKDAIPQKPVLFLKPPSVLKVCPSWQQALTLTLPNNAAPGDIHYECELVFLIGQDGQLSHVTVGLDMTNRVLQRQAKDTGSPWEIGKVFADAATIGPWIPLSMVDLNILSFELRLNGVIKQQAKVSDMRMEPSALLDYAREYFPICAGDLLYTGTPAGVGAVKAGDVCRLTILGHSYQVKWQ